MQTTTEFISNLSNLDIKLWIEDLDEVKLRCNAPKGALTPEIKAELADRKAEIIALLQQGDLDGNSTSETIEPIDRNQNLVVSFAQARQWFFDRLEGASATYNIPVSLQLLGDLNVAALQMAATEIVRRHEVLRTHFELVNDAPIQVIGSDISIDIPVIDLQQLSELERPSKVKQLAIDESQQPFDLAVAPLVRVKLLQLDRTSHVLLITMHHIISDGWSMGVFINELSELYRSFYAGKPSPLPVLTIQYADFAHWQKQWLTGDVLAKQIDYWKQLLTGAPPLLELPTDRPRPSMQTFTGSFVEFPLEQGLSQQLTTLSQQSGTTLFMTMLAAFMVLMARYSGQDDVVIGSPIANRNRSETEPLIGFFVNTLVLRTKLQENSTFVELLASVKHLTLDAQDHQDLPFEKLVEELQPERSLSYSPLFQVMFELDNTPIGNFELPGLEIAPLELENINAKFDLTLSIHSSESGLECGWEYKTDLFDRQTIDRLAVNFQTLLASIVTNPQQRVAQLSLLDRDAHKQIVEEWNQTQTDYPLTQCFPQLFEAQVARTPDAIAVSYHDRSFTYQELNDRANRWARHLVELGVGAEKIVALVSDRHPDFLTAMLAIFKAGGAYLPLNPHHPAERTGQVLAQSQVPLILTSSSWTSMLEPMMSNLAKSQLVDFQQLNASEYSSENLPIRCTPDNLAYVIFTSGSTGKPKGAMLEHRGMLNHLAVKVTDLKLTPQDIVAQTAAQTFDISIWQFLIPLLVGGTVEIVSTEIAADPSQLLALVARQQISILEIVPSLLRAILQQICLQQRCANELNGNPPPLSLRWLLLTGETLPPQLCRQWLDYYPNIPLMNAYGPTECSDDVTHYPIYTAPDPEILNLPIGRPIANTQLYILDKHLQPVPIGVAGELHVGGAGVGRGYLDAPELTAKVFIPNPINPQLSPRLYKTGDKARYLPDGKIEFLGRIDFQVKIRGFRIELGEIEAILTQHPEIQAVAVIDREDKPGNQYLAAYIVSTAELTTADLRDFLKQKLPDYMLPGAFVFLDRIPLTANGKVDRQALPVPDLAANDTFIPPSDAIEFQLMQIWEEVLQITPIGIRDNFFNLGGHSLLAVGLMARIQQQFDKKLSLATLFQGATIEHLAQIIRSTTPADPFASTLMPLQRGDGSQRPLFFVHPGGGTVLSYLELSRHLDPDQPVYGLESLDLDEEQRLHTKVEDMAAYYIQVMQSVQPQGPYQIGGWSFGGLVAFEIAQQLRSQGHETSSVILLDTSPFTEFEELNEADDVDFLAELLARKNGAILGIPPELDVVQAQRLLHVFKGHILAANDYHLQPYPGTVDLFLAEGGIAADSLESIARWQQLATLGVNVHWIPGDHHTMVTNPNVQVLAEKLQICLGKLKVDTSPYGDATLRLCSVQEVERKVEK